MKANIIKNVRFLVEQKCDNFEFELSELDMVYRDDWYVNAFIEDNDGDADKAADAILKALVYRKKYQVYKIQAKELPMEMFHWNMRTGRDICGKKLIWVNFGCYRKIPELLDIALKVEFVLSTIDFNAHEKYAIFADLRGLSLQSLDMRLIRKTSSMVTTCFPGLNDHMYIFGLPLTLTAVIKTLVNMLPSRYMNQVTFLTLAEAKARVGHLFSEPKPESSNIRQVLLKDKIPEARIDQIVDMFNGCRKSSDKLFEQLQL
ncbi:hypothetical protein HDE_05685 [Halotydeus destructor]|nr:hypothetical protein HDE_05685 [Halotydeus destructor]